MLIVGICSFIQFFKSIAFQLLQFSVVMNAILYVAIMLLKTVVGSLLHLIPVNTPVWNNKEYMLLSDPSVWNSSFRKR